MKERIEEIRKEALTTIEAMQNRWPVAFIICIAILFIQHNLGVSAPSPAVMNIMTIAFVLSLFIDARKDIKIERLEAELEYYKQGRIKSR